MGGPPDDALEAGLAAGREEAFAAAYDRFAARLLAAAWGLLGNRAEAEDAVQDVFLGLAQSRSSLAGVENLEAYLFASLRHAAARRWGRRGNERPLPDAPAPARGADHPAPAVDIDRTVRLERALAALPQEQREVLALKIDGGLTFAEVADVLGTSINTAASRYRYALEKLRARLNED